VSPEASRGNLPGASSTLVGRADVLPELMALVRSRRLVTVGGVGGVGKTTLALAAGAQLVDDFPDGRWLVELAPVGNPEAVPDAIATALGITPQGDAPGHRRGRGCSGRTPAAHPGRNCEHLLTAAAAAIGEILARSDAPRILATSRESLQVPGRRS
jgi:predicted ATPase